MNSRRAINRTGITLGARLKREMRLGVAEINRGKGIEYPDAETAIADICGPEYAKKARRRAASS